MGYNNGRFKFEKVEYCPVCGGKGEFEFAARHKEGEFDGIIKIDVCKNCDTSYHNPRMTEESLKDYYASGTYRTFPGRAFKPEVKTIGNKNRVNYWQSVFEFNPKRYLDYGCSQGYMLQAVKEKFGSEVVGYDVYNDPGALMPIITDKNEITGKFDLISCIHVLEHLYNPMAELTWMASKLEENGTIVIEIPLYRQIIIPHLVLYSRKSMPLLVQHLGLQGFILDLKQIEIGVILARRKPWDIDRINDRTKLVGKFIPLEEVAKYNHPVEDYRLTDYELGMTKAIE